MGKRVISRRRGAGTGRYRSPSHRHHGAVLHPSESLIGQGTVVALQQAPGRSAPVALIQGPDGKELRTLASAGIATGDHISINHGRADRGSILPLGEIADGTLVSNIEVNP